jgi:hypothetical protein
MLELGPIFLKTGNSPFMVEASLFFKKWIRKRKSSFQEFLQIEYTLRKE